MGSDTIPLFHKPPMMLHTTSHSAPVTKIRAKVFLKNAMRMISVSNNVKNMKKPGPSIKLCFATWMEIRFITNTVVQAITKYFTNLSVLPDNLDNEIKLLPNNKKKMNEPSVSIAQASMMSHGCSGKIPFRKGCSGFKTW